MLSCLSLLSFLWSHISSLQGPPQPRTGWNQLTSSPVPLLCFSKLSNEAGGWYVWNTTLYNTVNCADGVKSSRFQALSPQRELTSVRLQTSWNSVWSALMHCHNFVRLAADGSKQNHRALWTLTVQSADQRAVDPSLSVVSESCHSRIVNQPSHSAEECLHIN